MPVKIETATHVSEKTVCECPENLKSVNTRKITNIDQQDAIECYACKGQTGRCDNVTGEGSLQICSGNISTCSLARMKDRVTKEVSLIN